MNRKSWTTEKIQEQLMMLAGEKRVMPSVSNLRKDGFNDLACAINKRGGIFSWAERLGLKRVQSDSDVGWAGEIAVAEILANNGFEVQRAPSLRSPFDLLVEGVLRVDVKTTHFHNYGYCTGWFYRIGKIVQADILALYQSDTKDVHWVPWYFTTCTNITITKTGDTYAWCKNNIGIVRRMAEVRAAEARMIQTTP